MALLLVFTTSLPALLTGGAVSASGIVARGAHNGVRASGFAPESSRCGIESRAALAHCPARWPADYETCPCPPVLPRRLAVSVALASAALPLLAQPAIALDGVREITPSTSRMGGLLDAYSDIGKGWSIYKPSTWNKFDGIPGEYETKWQDLIGATEQILVRRRLAFALALRQAVRLT